MKRINAQTDLVGASMRPEIEHNPMSGSKKTLNGLGVLVFLGGTTAVPVQKGQWIAVYRNAATTGFVGFGGSAVGVPAAMGVDVIPCTPFNWTVLCVAPGTNYSHARTDGALTAIYLIPDSGIISESANY